GALAASAVVAGRPAGACRDAGEVPVRRQGGGRAAARLVVDGGDARTAGEAQRRAVLGGSQEPSGDAVVAYRGLRVPADARRAGRTTAAVREGGAAYLGRPDREDLRHRAGVRLLQRRPGRGGDRGRLRTRRPRPGPWSRGEPYS